MSIATTEPQTYLLSFGVALAISSLTSMVGISGAFALVPFQVSILGLSGPLVSSTNLLFNLVATPTGVWRYARAGRFSWRIVGLLAAGTIPGMLAGAWIRVQYLQDPLHFRRFVGFFLLLVGLRLLWGLMGEARNRRIIPNGAETSGLPGAGDWSLRGTAPMTGIALLVGLAGGVYGVGGGLILAPVLVLGWRLPLRVIAGPVLASTWIASAAGVLGYCLAGLSGDSTVLPDFPLALSMGLGGALGTYCGSSLQERVSTTVLLAILALIVLAVAVRYLAF